jgi:hypothetical protein
MIETRTENCTTSYIQYTDIHVHYHNITFGLYVHYNKFSWVSNFVSSLFSGSIQLSFALFPPTDA